MKKKWLNIMTVSVVALVAGYCMYMPNSSEAMSDLSLANVEALAQAETGDIIDNCVWSESKFCYYVVVTPNGNEA